MLEAAFIHLQQRGSDAAAVSTFLEGSVVGVVLPLFLSFVLRVARSKDFPKTTDRFQVHLPTVLRRLGRILSRFSPGERTQSVPVDASEGRKEEFSLHETTHPYERVNKRVRVRIPGCRSFTLKFDPSCCTRNTDKLVVSATHDADMPDAQPTTIEFSGRFFSSEADSCEHTVPGDTLTLEFHCIPASTDGLQSGATDNCGSVQNNGACDITKDGADHHANAVATVKADSDSASKASALQSNATAPSNVSATCTSVCAAVSLTEVSAGDNANKTKQKGESVSLSLSESKGAEASASATNSAMTETPGLWSVCTD